MGEKRNAYRIFVRNQEGKRPLGRPRRRRMVNIKTILRETGWGVMNWTDRFWIVTCGGLLSTW
jgi:hypothetical protein